MVAQTKTGVIAAGNYPRFMARQQAVLTSWIL